MGDYDPGPTNKNKDNWGKFWGLTSGGGGMDQATGLMPSTKGEAEHRWNTMWGKPSDQELDFNKMLQGEQADIAQNLFSMAKQDWQTKQPVMRGVLGNSMNFMLGNSNPADHPWYESNKSGIESQYQDARDMALANQAAGGGLDESLADIEMGRAKGVTDLMGQIIQDEYNKAFGIATDAPGQAYGGMGIAGSQMGQAAQSYNQYIQQQQQNANQNAQAAGTTVGSMITK